MAMATRAFSRSKFAFFSSILLQNLKTTPIKSNPMLLKSTELALESWRPICGLRLYHDGRPRGPLWRGKKLIGKEALFVISGLKLFEDVEEKLGKFVNTHVLRLLKTDMIAVLTELERQEEVALAIKVFNVIRKQDWYKPDVYLYKKGRTQCTRLPLYAGSGRGECRLALPPFMERLLPSLEPETYRSWAKALAIAPSATSDVYLYKDLIIALARSKKMEDVMLLWDSVKREDLFPDSQTYTEVIRGFLNSGCPTDAMNIYEDMKQSPDPPEELPFRILLKGLLPHPLLRNRVKQDFEELFPEQHVYDPPEEIFGMRG